MHRNHLKGLLKKKYLSLNPRYSPLVHLGEAQTTCIFKKLPGGVGAAGLGTTLEKPGDGFSVTLSQVRAWSGWHFSICFLNPPVLSLCYAGQKAWVSSIFSCWVPLVKLVGEMFSRRSRYSTVSRKHLLLGQLHDILSPPEDTRLSVWIQFIYVVSFRHRQLPFAVSACWDSFPMLTRENNFSLISLSLEEAPGEIVLPFSFWRFLLRLLTIANFLKESGEMDFLQKLIYGHLFWEDGLSHFPCLMLTAEIQW